MRTYTVHLPARDPKADGIPVPETEAILIKEGFSWPALLFSFLWAIWHRLWLVAAGILALTIVLGLAVELAGGDGLVRTVVSLGFALIVGITANDLRRWTLARHGVVEVDVVSGDDSDEALVRHLQSIATSRSRSILDPGFTGIVR